MSHKPIVQENSTKKVLTLVPKPPPLEDRAYMLKRFDEDAAHLRKQLEEGNIPGYVIVGYDRIKEEGIPHFRSWCMYFTTDPADGYLLPDLAKTSVYQRIHED